MRRSRFPIAVTALVLAFLYLPILILVVNSFNPARFSSRWEGFSLVWYAKLFQSPEIWQAVKNTLIIAVSVTAVSVVLGTAAAYALHRCGSSRLQRVHYTLIYQPLVVPEILMGISLLMAFVAVGVPLGLFTIFLAHVTFCVSYVAMTVLGRLQDFDFSVIEAARDLGASPWQSTRKVLLPMLMPGHRRRGPARLHPVGRRLRHHLLRRRARLDDPAPADLQHDQVRRAADDQRPVDAPAGRDADRRPRQPALSRAALRRHDPGYFAG